MDFIPTLFSWYALHGRTLPWRETTDPYRIWVAEIILQQTRVDQGIDYYYRFLNRFPSLTDLSLAPLNEVLLIWQGLGYYSRARNLHRAAQELVKQGFTTLPADYSQLLRLPGVGPYTAAAIASFAFQLPFAVVDGNVYRFLARYFGWEIPIDMAAGKQAFANLATRLLDRQQPGTFNQAMMEFGALQCKPGRPNCALCPFAENCVARQNGLIGTLPLKIKKPKVRKRYLHFLHLCSTAVPSGFYLVQRDNRDIWPGLYSFPMAESKGRRSIQTVQKELLPQAFPFIQQAQLMGWSRQMEHALTHQTLVVRVYQYQIDDQMHVSLPPDWQFVPPGQLLHFPLPRLMQRYLEQRSDRRKEAGHDSTDK